jgi:predicted DNA-binding transcriptional regulator AlpA
MPIKRGAITYFTVNEVAEQVKCSRTSIWRWRTAGKIPQGSRYRDKELLFTGEEVMVIYAHAHRLASDENVAEFKHQLKLLL